MPGESNQWSRFSPLVQDKILHQAEGPTLDKKQEHYYFDEGMKDDRGHSVNHRKKHADFLKDLIALANTARRQGENAYLCLGIAEFDDWTVWGVQGRHPNKNPRISWEAVQEHPDLISGWAESIQRTYVDHARRFIEPGLPEVHYETGWYDDDHLLGLLVIEPTRDAPCGFFLTEKSTKRSDLRNLGLEPGSSWRRLGALNEPVEPNQRRWMLPSYSDYSYIPLAGWRVYLSKLSEYVIDDPNQPNLYQPLPGHHLGRDVGNIEDFLNQFARGKETPNVLMVLGNPGCGKTTLLKRLANSLAVEASQTIEATHGQPYVPGQLRALDFPKGAPIPVLVRLWGYEQRHMDTPESRFCRAMTNEAGELLKFDQHPSPASILNDRDLDFVVMLDGLDEISRNNRARTLSALTGFINDHPHARFIITCRGDLLQDMGPEWREFPQLYIAPMLPVQARQYLAGTAWESLLDRNDILTSTLQLLCNPRRINALREVTQITPSLGVVLENAIEGYLTEEHGKYVHQQQQRFRLEQQIDKFAFLLLEQGVNSIGEEEAREVLRAQTFNWLYRAGLITLHDGYCGLIEPLLRDYFAARRLLSLCRSHRLKPMMDNITSDPARWHRAIQIAANISSEDITTPPIMDLLVMLSPEHRLQAILERRYTAIRNVDAVETALFEYLQAGDVNDELVIRLLNDPSPATMRAAIRAVKAVRYLPMTDALYNLAALFPQDDDLRWSIGSLLDDWGDSRGAELQLEKEEDMDIIGQQEDQDVSAELLGSSILTEIGG